MKRVVIDIEQVQENLCNGMCNDRSERECNHKCQNAVYKGADQVHPNNGRHPAADGFEDPDLVGLLCDEVGDRIED
ncbi:MAG TPA: hypothetical protein VIV15_09575, partial [Anaerolineales bacterium]